jgi:hypothetical protein
MTAVGVRRLLQVVGVGSLLCGILGAAITGGMVYIVSQRMFILPVVAAYHSLYVVAMINVLWLGTLVWYGTRFLRGETAVVVPFCGLVVSEVLYAWATVTFGRQLNVDDAMQGGFIVGIRLANVGLWVQYYTLFPIWGAGLALWALYESRRNARLLVPEVRSQNVQTWPPSGLRAFDPSTPHNGLPHTEIYSDRSRMRPG